ncbi:ArsR/SmtB family transcription factor [Mesobacillus foraminis]|uniref:ArsR/SmtB family transcription factor n=1 Tax=Mesobacillus foraminis TaxID=279826 RepID=UPI000EF472E0
MKHTIETITALQLLKFLSSVNRLNMLRLLLDDERTVNEIMVFLNLGKKSVTLDINRLKRAGLVNVKRRGQVNFYYLNPDFKYIEFIKCLIDYLPCKEIKLRS